jgi:hypothetical protein
MGGWGSVVIGGVWRGATVAEIAMVDNGEMRTANQVEALFGQRTSVGGFEKVSIKGPILASLIFFWSFRYWGHPSGRYCTFLVLVVVLKMQ